MAAILHLKPVSVERATAQAMSVESAVLAAPPVSPAAPVASGSAPSPVPPRTSPRVRLVREFLSQALPPMIGILLFISFWAAVSSQTQYLPGPSVVWTAAVELFSDPFYRHGPNDVGVGWLLLHSLGRVAMGFGLAVAVGVPLGFMIGRFAFLNRAVAPIIGVLKPVSPLAWLPIGLATFQAADPSAIFVIFITSIWPMVINTALGVSSVPQDYLNVARVLRLSEWKIFTSILFPACIPFMVTGMRLGLGIAWLVIVAAEMLTGGLGIGFWVWDEWNNLNMAHIVIAIFLIGGVGLVLEKGMSLIGDRFDYRKK
jgi:nitrate/nitrite transport system permease protein